MARAPQSVSRPQRRPWSFDWSAPQGWQRSHRVPQQMANEPFWDLVRRAPDSGIVNGQRVSRWDIFDPLDNGQPLPSNTSGAAAQAYDPLADSSLTDAQRAQHRGSHPEVNRAVSARLSAWDTELRDDLRALGFNDLTRVDYDNPNVQSLLLEYNQRARNLSDAIALVSVSGYGDVAGGLAGERAVYNRADPRHLAGSNPLAQVVVSSALSTTRHLGRDIPALVRAGGLHIEDMEAMYLPSTPRFAGYNYWGSAGVV